MNALISGLVTVLTVLNNKLALNNSVKDISKKRYKDITFSNDETTLATEIKRLGSSDFKVEEIAQRMLYLSGTDLSKAAIALTLSAFVIWWNSIKKIEESGAAFTNTNEIFFFPLFLILQSWVAVYLVKVNYTYRFEISQLNVQQIPELFSEHCTISKKIMMTISIGLTSLIISTYLLTKYIQL